jgi:acyl carrier protein
VSGALEAAFDRAFELPAGTDHEALVYREHEGWDSLGHMTLVTELEDAFGVELATEDIVALTSFPAAREILRRYGAEV